MIKRKCMYTHACTYKETHKENATVRNKGDYITHTHTSHSATGWELGAGESGNGGILLTSDEWATQRNPLFSEQLLYVQVLVSAFLTVIEKI